MMISVVIVGINQWEEYTKPLIDSIKRFEPGTEIIVIDNNSDEQYPFQRNIFRTNFRMSYAEAINYGVEKTHGDWILSLNNDVVCRAKFNYIVKELAQDAIYARQIIEEKGYVWFGNWLALIPRDVWKKVGEFDPQFKMCGFEDADYSIRAKKLGIDTKPVDLPFHHYWGKTRWQLPQYPAVRCHNMEYLEKKHGVRLGDNVRVTHD